MYSHYSCTATLRASNPMGYRLIKQAWACVATPEFLSDALRGTASDALRGTASG